MDQGGSLGDPGGGSLIGKKKWDAATTSQKIHMLNKPSYLLEWMKESLNPFPLRRDFIWLASSDDENAPISTINRVLDPAVDLALDRKPFRLSLSRKASASFKVLVLPKIKV